MTNNFNRRRFLSCTGIIAAGSTIPAVAGALSIEPMNATTRGEFAQRCGGDANHEALMADVRAALEGKAPADQAAATLARIDQAPRCPLCGCPMLVASVTTEQPQKQ